MDDFFSTSYFSVIVTFIYYCRWVQDLPKLPSPKARSSPPPPLLATPSVSPFFPLSSFQPPSFPPPLLTQQKHRLPPPPPPNNLHPLQTRSPSIHPQQNLRLPPRSPPSLFHALIPPRCNIVAFRRPTHLEFCRFGVSLGLGFRS